MKTEIYRPTIKDFARIPNRPADSNKGTFGKVLVIAGTMNMAGAAYFSAKAAYRTGAGLVRILTHHSNRVVLQTLLPEAILTTYEESTKQEQSLIEEAIDWASVIVIGPGLGQSSFSLRLLETVLHRGTVPCVIDADALNLIASHRLDLGFLQSMREHRPSAGTIDNGKLQYIITPHMGEMSRLMELDITSLKEKPVQAAMAYSARHHVITVLKDARTITALPTGVCYENTSGNNGMSTGGSGDVLTGMIAGLVTQGCSLEDAAFLGVYLHGLAGDAAAKELGARSVMASDILDHIYKVLKEGNCHE